jgi:hypothetical protein
MPCLPDAASPSKYAIRRHLATTAAARIRRLARHMRSESVLAHVERDPASILTPAISLPLPSSKSQFNDAQPVGTIGELTASLQT